MFINKLQKNKFFLNKIKSEQDGFTILEALVAITILLISVGAMLTITATTTKAARYGKNEITANYLLQEAVDSIRNSRDTVAFQQKATDTDATAWITNFMNRYAGCFSTYGCDLSMDQFNATGSGAPNDITVCGLNGCTPLIYHPNGGANLYYSRTEVVGDTDSIFTRNIKMTKTLADPDFQGVFDEVDIVATVTWKNDASTILNTRTLKTSLLNWQK